MNRRQKKKRYKKLYGHNPPKGWNGSINEPAYTVNGHTLTYDDISELAETVTEAWRNVAAALADLVENIGKGFMAAAENMRKNQEPVRLPEDNAVVFARKMTENRQKKFGSRGRSRRRRS